MLNVEPVFLIPTYSLSEWLSAVADASERKDCQDGDGNLTCRFWTDGDRVWVTPANQVERNALRIEYHFEKGVGYMPD